MDVLWIGIGLPQSRARLVSLQFCLAPGKRKYETLLNPNVATEAFQISRGRNQPVGLQIVISIHYSLLLEGSRGENHRLDISGPYLSYSATRTWPQSKRMFIVNRRAYCIKVHQELQQILHVAGVFVLVAVSACLCVCADVSCCCCCVVVLALVLILVLVLVLVVLMAEM